MLTTTQPWQDNASFKKWQDDAIEHVFKYNNPTRDGKKDVFKVMFHTRLAITMEDVFEFTSTKPLITKRLINTKTSYVKEHIKIQKMLTQARIAVRLRFTDLSTSSDDENNAVIALGLLSRS